jgi:hypothetical protein
MMDLHADNHCRAKAAAAVIPDHQEGGGIQEGSRREEREGVGHVEQRSLTHVSCFNGHQKTMHELRSEWLGEMC